MLIVSELAEALEGFNSMIVRLKVVDVSREKRESMFQFYDSPIKSTGNDNVHIATYGFNSMIVRLKEEIENVIKYLKSKFQFYDSPIKRGASG